MSEDETVPSPRGLAEPWLAVWDAALAQLVAQGSWQPEQAPLLAEYVFALREAEKAREALPALVEELERWLDGAGDEAVPVAWSTVARIASGAPALWDKHVRRAQALADQLALTPRGRLAARVGLGDDEEDERPVAVSFDALDNVTPIGPRRGR